MSNETDYLSDFLSGLESDKSKPAEKKDYLLTLLMEIIDNQGQVIFAPFPFTENNKFYELVNSVKEIKTTTKLIKSDKAVWLKILPKQYYGTLTSEQSKLYDEVSGLWESAKEKLDKKANSYKKIRFRRYSIFQGIILNHINTKNKPIADHKKKAAVLIYPTNSIVDALHTATVGKINEFNGSKEWLPTVLTPDKEGREGSLSITFSKFPSKAGYDCSVSFGFNSAFSKIIKPEDLPDTEISKLATNPTRELLRWQIGKDSLFNDELFEELKLVLSGIIMKDSTTVSKDQPVKVVNGIDPMLESDDEALPEDDLDTDIDEDTGSEEDGDGDYPF